jgi:hypothetical protein
MDVCLLWVLCVVKVEVSATGRSSRVVLTSVWVWSWSLDNEEALTQGDEPHASRSKCVQLQVPAAFTVEERATLGIGEVAGWT